MLFVFNTVLSMYEINDIYIILLKIFFLEKRLIKFIHSALNGNEMYKQVLCVKLRCKKSSFAENYRYLSWKNNFSDCDWFTNIAYLKGKVKIAHLLLYPVSDDASVLHDLCCMRDDDFCGIFTTEQLKQLIIDISFNLIIIYFCLYVYLPLLDCIFFLV